MKYQLKFNYINFHPLPPDTWWKTTNYLYKVLEIVYNSNIINIRYLHQDEFIATNNLKQTEKLCEKFTEKDELGFKLTSFNNDYLNNAIHFYLTHESIGILLMLTEPSRSMFDKLVFLIWELYEEFKDIASFGPNIVISSFMHEYPKYKPERNYQNLEPDSLYNFIQAGYFNKNLQIKPDGLEHLFKTELPKGVLRVLKDDIAAIQWTAKVDQEEEITKALMQREEWIYKHIKLKPTDRFNDDGDKKLYNISTLQNISEEESFFNYYKERLQVAFKAIVLDENSELDQETIIKISHYNDTSLLDSGAPIKKIVLVLPTRKHAMHINIKAKELGVFKVVYLDDDANIWDMYPAGNWRN
jgi:hypothetical protein